ncbi:hypothetical protein GCK72_021450 [Caenorhabditis remanei]|uniref:F-box domain-containing protein n=1 Tax=Caenorhabditis remanei TaxID=31234 RepID=A0A6A5GK02_CAERE|nr:hypothetical protein GCK72_021450 [Caenorhabditis remanei]KAF1754885.1 hypothetical protein GCK72_021450 [Caenorhabditis remanei]
MPSQTLLVDFPAVVKSKVIEKLDFLSILKLRKVCYNLRQFIDENPPKSQCWNVRVSTFSEIISIKFESPNNMKISFKPIENGCVMSWSNDDIFKSEEFHDESYIDVYLRELGIIMKHKRRPVLDYFSIELFNGEGSKEVLKELTRIGCVSTDELTFVGCTQIAKFLPFFDSNNLIKIRIKCHFVPALEDQEHAMRILNLQEIRQLEQWKNSKHVTFEAVDFCVQIQDFLHFEQVRINCKMISIQDIVLLKECFRTSSTLSSFVIRVYDGFNEIEQLHASLGFPSLQVDLGNPEEIWFSRIPNNEDVLRVFCNMEDLFYFCRIKIQDVPKGAVISD